MVYVSGRPEECPIKGIFFEEGCTSLDIAVLQTGLTSPQGRKQPESAL